mgnify:CR=1 FL=1
MYPVAAPSCLIALPHSLRPCRTMRALVVLAVIIQSWPSLAQSCSIRNAATTHSHAHQAGQPPLQPSSAICCYAGVPHIQRPKLLHECCYCGHRSVCYIRVAFKGKIFLACSQQGIQHNNSN